MTEWISVEDRLPVAIASRVLVFPYPPNRADAIYGGGEFFVDGHPHPTSHWMPLPEPPGGTDQ